MSQGFRGWLPKKLQGTNQRISSLRHIQRGRQSLFRELLAGSIGGHRQMGIARLGKTQATLQPDLAGG